MGQSALNDNTTGLGNTAYGAFALYKNTDGFQNTAIGVNALKDNTSGVNNTALGKMPSTKTKREMLIQLPELFHFTKTQQDSTIRLWVQMRSLKIQSEITIQLPGLFANPKH